MENKNRWSLIYLSKAKSLAMKIPIYQRGINKVKIKEIKNSLDEWEAWDIPPIIMNKDNEIVDGQHRWEAYRQSKCTYDIPVLIKEDIGKKEFTVFNNSTSISIAHLLFIHDTMQYLSKQIQITKGSSTKSSIGVSDLAKGIWLKLNLRLKSPNKKELFKMLENEKMSDIVESAQLVNKVLKIYYGALPFGTKTKQIWFLYFVFLYSKGLINDNRIERCVPRLPNTAGGDIALGENKAIFLNSINYKARKNIISISDLF